MVMQGIGTFATLGTFFSVASNVQEDMIFKNITDLQFSNSKANTINDPNAKDGRTKLQITSQFLQAALDNEKDPILGKIHANKHTFGAIQAMIAMGYNEEVIVPFINQPVVRDYITNLQYILENDDSFEGDVKEKAYDRTISSDETVSFNESSVVLPSTEDIGDQDKRDINLKHFLRLQDAGKEIQWVKSVINTDSALAPKSLIDSFDKESNINSLNQSMITNADKLLGTYENVNGEEVLTTPEGISGLNSYYGIIKANEVWNKLQYPYKQKFFDKVFSEISDISGRMLNGDEKKEIAKNVKDYAYTAAVQPLLENNIYNERERILTGKNSLAVRLQKAKRLIKDNVFLDLLYVQKNPNSIDTINFNNAAMQGLNEDYIYNSFTDLILDNKTTTLAQDLILYSLITNSNITPRSFVKFIPAEYITSLGINKSYILNFADDKTDNFVTQFIQNNPRFANRVEAKNSDSFNESTKENRQKYKSFFDSTEKKWKLYSLADDNGNYQRINTLGQGTLIKEYDYTTPYFESVVKRNNLPLSGIIAADSKVEDKKIPTLVLDEEGESESYLAKFDTSNSDRLTKTILQNSNLNDNQKTLLELFDKLKINATVAVGKFDFRGSFDSNANRIALNQSMSESKFVDTYIHEYIHGLTSDLVNNKQNLSKDEQTYINQIEGIRVNYFEQLAKEDKDTFTSFNKKLEYAKNNKDKYLDDPFTDKERKLYNVHNTKEFIVSLFTEQQVIDDLNNKKFQGNKTLIERFIEILSDFVSKISGKVKSGSELEEALKNTLGLIQGNVQTEESISDSEIQQIANQLDLSPVSFDEREYLDTNLKVERLKGGFPKVFKSYDEAVSEQIRLNSEYQGTKKFVTLKEGKGYELDLIQNYNHSLDYAPKENSNEAKIINSLRSDAKFLELRIREEDNSNLKIKFQNDLDKINDQINELEEEGSTKTIIKIAKEQLVSTIEPLSKQEITSEELNQISRTLGLWLNADSYLLDQERLDDPQYLESKTVKDILAIRGQAGELLQGYWLNKARKFTQKVGKDVDIDKTIEEIFGKEDGRLGVERDIRATNRYFRGINTSNSPLLSIVDKKIKSAKIEANEDSVESFKEIDEKFENFKKTSFFKRYGMSKFFQKSKGKSTGNLVDRYTQEFYDQEKKLINRAKRLKAEGKDSGNAWKKYYNWRQENRVEIDVNKLFTQEEDGTIKFKEDKKYVRQLEDRFGSEIVNNAIQRTKDKMKVYERDYMSMMELSTNDGVVDIQPVERWKAENSPFLRANGVLDSKIGADKIYNKGYKYYDSIPVEKWIDQDYLLISEDKEALEFLDWYKSKIRSFYRLSPDSVFQEFQYNYLPIIPKSTMEHLQNEGLMAAGVDALDRFNKSLVERGVNLTIDTDRITHRPEYHLEYPFRNPNFRTEGERSRMIADSSQDLQKIIKIVTKESINYKYMNDIQDDVKLVQSVFEFQKEVKTKVNRTQYGINKEEEILSNAPINKKEQLAYTITNSLYGINEEGTFNPKVGKKRLTSSEKKTLKELKEEYESANTQEEKEKIQKKIESLGGRLSTRKIVRDLLNWIQFKGMGYNILSAVGNKAFALMSNYVHAQGGEDFNQGNLNKALGLMLNSTKNIAPGIAIGALAGSVILPGYGTIIGAGVGGLFMGDKANNRHGKKIQNLMKRFDTLGDIIDVNDFTKNYYSGERKFYQRFLPYELQRKSEYFSYGTTMVAMMLNRKVQTNKGELNLYEIFDDNAEIRTDIELKEDFDSTAFKIKMDEVNEIIHGNYNKNSPVEIKKHAFGQMIMQFRSWMPEGFATRFDDDKYSYNLNRVREGRYRLYFGENRGQNLKNLGRTLTASLRRLVFLQNNKIYDDLKEHELANLRKNAAELHTIVSVIGLALILKAGIDDDDEDSFRRYLSNFALNSLFRLQDDLMYFANPLSAEQLTRSSIPALKTIPDGLRVIDYTTRVLFDEDIDDQTYDAWVNNSLRFFGGSNYLNAQKAQEQLFNRNYR